MSFLFNDLFGGGMPGGHHHHHHHGHGGNDSDDEPVDTEKFYTLLDIAKNATQQEIKKAYRKKAKSLHPDRHPGEHEKYQQLFTEVQAAHEVLSDPQKRSLYDKYGEKGVKRGGAPRTGSSIFEQMFGGGGGRSAHDDHGAKKSPAIKTALDVTLQDIYCGSKKKMKIQRRVAASDSKECSRCHGQGQITSVQRMGPMVLQQRRECPLCGGIGYKLERQEHEIEVHIPIGGRHGENMTIQGEGNQYPSMEAGDVVIQLRVVKHELYNRKGADLGMNYTLSLRQALCGYKIRIQHVSGKNLVITPCDASEIVQPGSLKVIHTMGVPQRFTPHVKGHLYIVMDVKMPLSASLSVQSINTFKKILPQQTIDDGEEEHNEEEEKQQTKPQQQQRSKKQNQKSKRNQRNKKGNKKKRNKKGGKGGVFGGLAGHYENKNKAKQTIDAMDEDEDEMFEEVQCHSIDGNPKATPASAGNYYNQDDDDETDGVQCRQM
eukprot:92823_1